MREFWERYRKEFNYAKNIEFADTCASILSFMDAQKERAKKPTLQEKMGNAKKKAVQEDAARQDSRGGKPKKHDECE